MEDGENRNFAKAQAGFGEIASSSRLKREWQQKKNQQMKFWVYMTANKPNGVIYTGQTHQLKERIHYHKIKKYKNSFSARYNVDKLVWFKEFDNILDARAMEKKLKAGSRAKKIKLTKVSHLISQIDFQRYTKTGYFVKFGF